MNKRRKEKSVLRKEGNVYVLDLFATFAANSGIAGNCQMCHREPRKLKTGKLPKDRCQDKLVQFEPRCFWIACFFFHFSARLLLVSASREIPFVQR